VLLLCREMPFSGVARITHTLLIETHTSRASTRRVRTYRYSRPTGSATPGRTTYSSCRGILRMTSARR
jgi:hypothetical protein